MSRFHTLTVWAPKLLTGVLLFVSTSQLSAAEGDGIAFFEKHVRPVLVQHCYECHSLKGGQKKGNLLLDSREGLLRGGDSGPAIVPGDPAASLLVQAIRYASEGLEMPPKQKLPEETIRRLEAWVAMGAPDPRSSQGAAAGGSPGVDFVKARQHWAFQPEKDAPPKIADNWVRQDIDRFVLAKLRERNWSPSAEADRAELIKRLYATLTGLPPSYEEVQAFTRGDTTVEETIDALLESPQYGEHWGRHWLDVARYADTMEVVFDMGRVYPFAHTYRDWVIHAHNADLPINRFIELQIAADKLVTAESKERGDLAALGFLTVGRQFFGDRQLQVDDQIDVVTRGLMGLTVACSRCHDHKFEAIPTADYYSLYGVFASSRPADDMPWIGYEPNHDPAKAAAYHEDRQKRLAAIEEHVVECLTDARKHVEDSARLYLNYLAQQEPNHRPQDGQVSTATSEIELRPAIIERYTKFFAANKAEADSLFGLWIRAAALPRNGVQSGLAALCRNEDGVLHPWVAAELKNGKTPVSMIEVGDLYARVFARASARADTEAVAMAEKLFGEQSALRVRRLDIVDDSRVTVPLIRTITNKQFFRFNGRRQGLHALEFGAPVKRAMVLEPRELVEPVVFVRGDPKSLGPRVPRQFLQILRECAPDPGPWPDDGRLQLARAVAANANPLTARVLVNRVWALHFGRGLVPTLDNFGVNTPEPEHAALLDHLALWFKRHDWSLKALHRYILTSATWRQSSRVENHDAALDDPENVLLWRQNPRRLNYESIRDTLLSVSGNLDPRMGGPSQPIDSAGNQRRTVYAYIDRFTFQPLPRAFGAPPAESAVLERKQTLVPQQALFMMNHPFVAQQASALVSRFAPETPLEQRVVELYRAVLARDPESDELEMARQFFQADDATWTDYAQALLMNHELIYLR